MNTMASRANQIALVGPDTPGGDLLRRYWHPIAVASELTVRTPKKRVRVLGEDLVLYRKLNGGYGLMVERCPHRGASLAYGWVEQEGLRCPYHGWLFDDEGSCIERPFEPSTAETFRHRAYKAEELAGLVFAYLGPPDRIPLLPRWEILAREDGTKVLQVHEDYACNWLQFQENAVDVTHTYFLHSQVLKSLGVADRTGFNRQFMQFGFQPFEWGILKSWRYRESGGQLGWGNPMIFPNMLRLMTEMHWRVPVDDVTTRVFVLTFIPESSGGLRGEIRLGDNPRRVGQSGEYILDTVIAQDAMALETQGPLADRSSERLGQSDIGILMLRRMLDEEIRKVQLGQDPLGIIRDPKRNQFIDLRIWMGEDLPMTCEPDPTPFERKLEGEIFDARHRIIDVRPDAFRRFGQGNRLF